MNVNYESLLCNQTLNFLVSTSTKILILSTVELASTNIDHSTVSNKNPKHEPMLQRTWTALIYLKKSINFSNSSLADGDGEYSEQTVEKKQTQKKKTEKRCGKKVYRGATEENFASI